MWQNMANNLATIIADLYPMWPWRNKLATNRSDLQYNLAKTLQNILARFSADLCPIVAQA